MLDLKKWSAREKFSISEAAYLWLGADPDEKISDEFKAEVDKIRRRLEHVFRWEISEHRGKTFQAYPDKSPGHALLLSPHFAISREQLRAVAEKWGESPAFLFSEDREIFDRLQKIPTQTLRAISKQDEDFIGSIRAWVDEFSEIRIQVPERPAKSYDYVALGFRDERTPNRSIKAWSLLLEILRELSQVGEWSVGPAHAGKDRHARIRNKEYDNKRHMLSRINFILVKFFNREFKLDISKDFEFLHLQDRHKRPGIYGIKLSIRNTVDDESKAKYKKFSDEDVRTELKILCSKYKEDPENGEVSEDLTILGHLAVKRKVLTREEFEEMLEGYEMPKEGEYDPHEKGPDKLQEIF